jgi:heptosyltransferase III
MTHALRRFLHAVEVRLRPWAGFVAALLLFRPWRRRFRQQLSTAKRVVVVRIDNRVGEALLTTPLLSALLNHHQVDCIVHPRCARVLQGFPGLGQIETFERRGLRLGDAFKQIARLRRFTNGAVVIDAANWKHYSGTQALLSRLIAPHSAVVGPACWPTPWLNEVSVNPRLDTQSEAEQRLHLGSPLQVSGSCRLGFRRPAPSETLQTWVRGLSRPLAVVNPGGRLKERRVPPGVFAHAALVLSAAGFCPVVTFGPGEEPLAQAVVEGCAQARLAPPTSLDDLAFLMQQAQLVVCNNTGPMHLAVAIGTRTVALFYGIDVRRWGHGEPHRMVVLDGLKDEQAMQRVVAAEVSRSLSL